QLDPNKGERPDRAEPSRQPFAPLPASQPEDQVLTQLPDVPDLVHDRRFREGARRLLAQGKTPGELVLAVGPLLGIPRSVEACHSLLTDLQDGPERHRTKSANRDKAESVQPSKQNIGSRI